MNMPIPGRLSEHDFYETIAEVFSTRGFEGASFVEISNALNISRPTLYTFSKSKDELFKIVSKRVADYCYECMPKYYRDDDPPATRLRAIFLLHLHVASTHRASLHMAIRSFIEGSAAIQPVLLDWWGKLNDITMTTIRDCQQEGVIPATIHPKIFRNIVRSILWDVIGWYDVNGKLSAEELVDQMMSVLLKPAIRASNLTTGRESQLLTVVEQGEGLIVVSLPFQKMTQKTRSDTDCRSDISTLVLRACAIADPHGFEKEVSLKFYGQKTDGEIRCELKRVHEKGKDSIWAVAVTVGKTGEMLCFGHVSRSRK
jgi:AcrR family transcriptional regulator